MQKVIDAILAKHRGLFGEDATAERINVGFTNVIYTVNNKFIIKICTKERKEAGFKKEVDFYTANKDNTLIPTLYFADTSKADIPYLYEILEKLEGVSLYNVWHTFSEDQREDIIKQLCDAMMQMHKAKSSTMNWAEHNKTIFNFLYKKAIDLQLVDYNEVKLLETALSVFDIYLPSDEFVLVHNDLHFDNVIYNNGKIKIIDFERAIYAPADFELDILYRMVRKPWKFASEEVAELTHPDQYKNIMGYIEKYYPHIINTPHLYKRLAIYDMIYFLRQYVNAPQCTELKDDVIVAAKVLLG